MLDVLKRLHEIFPTFKLGQDDQTGVWYVPLNEPCERTPVYPAFKILTEGCEYLL